MSLNCPCCGVALELALVRPRKESIPDWLRRQVFERDGWACVTCGNTENLTADHIYPEFYGGESTLENLQTLCRSCNSIKGKTRRSNEESQATPTASTSVEGKVLDLQPQTKPKPIRRKNAYTNPDFHRFWEVYPLRKEKYAAFRAFMRFVVDAGVDVEVVLAAAAAYRDDPERDPKFTKYPQGWLSAGRWEDEREAVKPPAKPDARYLPYDHEAHMRALEDIR